MIERSRGVEARIILGDVRKLAVAWRLEHGSLNATASSPAFDNAQATIGNNNDQLPGPALGQCRSSYWFYYSVAEADPSVTITATRCSNANGKPPRGPRVGMTLTLTSNLVTNTDVWGGSGDY